MDCVNNVHCISIFIECFLPSPTTPSKKTPQRNKQKQTNKIVGIRLIAKVTFKHHIEKKNISEVI